MIEILRITGAHGIRGAVRVVLFSEHIENYKKIYDKDNNEFTFRVLKHTGKNIAIISIDGISDRNEAESLNGSYFFIKKEDLPKISKNEFYLRDLINKTMKISGSSKECRIIGVYNFGAGDLVEISSSDGKTFFVPFTLENFPDSDPDNDIMISIEAFEKFYKTAE